MLTQPYQLYVERTDEARNMARFYAMAIKPSFPDGRHQAQFRDRRNGPLHPKCKRYRLSDQCSDDTGRAEYGVGTVR